MPPKRKTSSQLERKSKVMKTEESNIDKNATDSWTQPFKHLHVLKLPSERGCDKIAAFDMDLTLIKPKGKNKWPKGRDDWTWLYELITKETLTQLHKNGFKIVIFTNQGGIEKGTTNSKEIMGKIDDISEDLGFPIEALISGAVNKFRKPHASMWNYYIEHMNQNIQPDLKVSFYCGDAAGRIEGWKKGAKKDFSNVDRSFAYNIGIMFKTPEEYFLMEAPTEEFKAPSLELIKRFENAVQHKEDSNPYHHLLDFSKQEVILFVGPPASGKSTFAKKYLIPNGYVHINKDTLKTKPKCIKLYKDSLNEKKSIVIDNTNPDKVTRAEYINLAKNFNVPIRCFYFTIDKQLSMHLNILREVYQDVRRIPDVGYNVFNSKFVAPTVDEGFQSVSELEFIPIFDNEIHEDLFKKSYIA